MTSRAELIEELRQLDTLDLTDRERFMLAYDIADADREWDERDRLLDDYLAKLQLSAQSLSMVHSLAMFTWLLPSVTFTSQHRKRPSTKFRAAPIRMASRCIFDPSPKSWACCASGPLEIQACPQLHR